MILCLETATTICSVALCDSAGIISLRESRENKSHASQLTVFIEELLKENNVRAKDLEAVAVSKGPGSYTGLRIGVSVAKGLAYAASLPLIGIETTMSMFYGIREEYLSKSGADSQTLFCPMIDARRMEAFYCLFDINGKVVRNISASVFDKDSFSDFPENVKIIFFGDGAGKFRNIISRSNSVFADQYVISAAHMHYPVYEAFNKGRFEDVAYFEPYYLKDFIATIPKKNIVGNQYNG
jgi:tRNA threonylcarbamoyladenosine biosynthesis protein TsaB